MEYKLTILGESPRTSSRRRVVAQCVCGNIKTYLKDDIFSGKTASCGCKRVAVTSKNRATHRLSHTPIYCSWYAMIQRCKNPRNHNWERYGERGITVCEEWKTFDVFYADMGEKPEGKQLDRIDNNKGYSPENCRWVTARENCNNREISIKIELGFFPLTISELAELALVSRSTISRRWHHYGDAVNCLFPFDGYLTGKNPLYQKNIINNATVSI